jgi:hypothetical protein
MNPWITYRTRFLVKAKQLSCSLSFTDELGRQHSGNRGDYLVEWSDGVLRIAPQKIFEDVYVPLPAHEELPRSADRHPGSAWDVLPQKSISPGKAFGLPIPTHLTRKSPQPCRDRRSPRQGMSSL